MVVQPNVRRKNPVKNLIALNVSCETASAQTSTTKPSESGSDTEENVIQLDNEKQRPAEAEAPPTTEGEPVFISYLKLKPNILCGNSIKPI